jgi:hypothetical protein
MQTSILELFLVFSSVFPEFSQSDLRPFRFSSESSRGSLAHRSFCACLCEIAWWSLSIYVASGELLLFFVQALE